MIPQNTLAGYMGYLSIAFWLCAQLPQVFKNAALRSCEGLALPFLVNWLFGDITNLIGCLLTDQLPFQKYLAAYFCVIDFTLLVQFFHYKPKSIISTHIHNHTHHSQPHTAYSTFSGTGNSATSLHTSLILPRRNSSRPATSRTRSTSTPAIQPLSSISHPSRIHHSDMDEVPSTSKSEHSESTARPRMHQAPTAHGSSSTLLESPGLERAGFHTDGSYAALYEAALDVARVAERVTNRSMRRSESRRRKLSRQTTNEGDEEVGEGMMESFHSEMSKWTDRSATSSTEGRAEGEWGRMTMSTPALGLTESGRGRSLKRVVTSEAVRGNQTPSETDDQATPLAAVHHHHHVHSDIIQQAEARKRDKSRSLSIARGSSGRGGRRAAGVAFMSLGLIARGWFPATSTGAIPWSPTQISNKPMGAVLSPTAAMSDHPIYRYPEMIHLRSTSENTHEFFFILDEEKKKPHNPQNDPPPSFDRIVGRISAWCCTTLYLTSRLPQIWKNFKRRSVEGLSILLFLFAFCGNLFYVISILLNPSGNADPADAGHYLMESLPYLLGSGGTLVFDLTIMIQSAIYGSSPPVTPTVDTHRRLRLPGKRRMNSARFAEEGAALHSAGPVERGERASLLMNSPAMGDYIRTPRSRERSFSPEVSSRLTPPSVGVATGEDSACQAI